MTLTFNHQKSNQFTRDSKWKFELNKKNNCFLRYHAHENGTDGQVTWNRHASGCFLCRSINVLGLSLFLIISRFQMKALLSPGVWGKRSRSVVTWYKDSVPWEVAESTSRYPVLPVELSITHRRSETLRERTDMEVFWGLKMEEETFTPPEKWRWYFRVSFEHR